MARAGIALAAAVVVVLAIAWALWPDAAPPAEPPEPHAATAVDLAQGRITGFVQENGAYAWLGIPFAQPPVGDLRWRAPQPPASFAEPLAATSTGSACVQFANALAEFEDADGDGIVGREDCLFLNVYAPAGASTDGRQRPVMFWIHGGGNSIGHAGPYDGGVLAERHDVVVVAANYRLGPFGWFTHPALRAAAASVGDASGNYGTLDLVRGLEWVRENIAAFGGDAGNVTIFGESAGGMNVMTLVVSPRAAGLFHRAIVQSGGLNLTPLAAAEEFAEGIPEGMVPGHAKSSAEVLAELLLRRGMAADKPAARRLAGDMAAEEVRALLYETDAVALVSLYGEAGGGLGMFRFPALLADGAVLPDAPPKEIFASAGNYNAVPTMLGTNRDEMKLFMALSPEWVERRFWLFPRLKDPDAYNRAARYASDSWKERGVDRLARLLSAAQGDTVFAYRFDWDEEGTVAGYDLSQAMGAAHGLEIGFVFGDFEGTALALGDLYDEDRIPQRDALSRSMMSYWAEFAHSGSPGRGRDGGEVAWQPWNNAPNAEKMIVFDTPRDGGIRMSPEEVTLASLKAQLLADLTFADQAERCLTYARLFRGTAAFQPAEYASLGGGEGCAAYPADEVDLF